MSLAKNSFVDKGDEAANKEKLSLTCFFLRSYHHNSNEEYQQLTIDDSRRNAILELVILSLFSEKHSLILFIAIRLKYFIM